MCRRCLDLGSRARLRRCSVGWGRWCRAASADLSPLSSSPTEVPTEDVDFGQDRNPIPLRLHGLYLHFQISHKIFKDSKEALRGLWRPLEALKARLEVYSPREAAEALLLFHHVILFGHRGQHLVGLGLLQSAALPHPLVQERQGQHQWHRRGEAEDQHAPHPVASQSHSIT